MASQEFLKKNLYLQTEVISAVVLYVLGAPPYVQVCVACDVMFYSYFPRANSLTQWSRISLGMLTIAKMVKFLYNAHNSHPHVPNHSEINPVYTFHPNLLESARFKYTRVSSNLSPSSRFSNQNFVNIFGFPLACHMPSPFYHSLFGCTNDIRRSIQLIIQICLFFIIKYKFPPTYAKYQRATPYRLCATV